MISCQERPFEALLSVVCFVYLYAMSFGRSGAATVEPLCSTVRRVFSQPFFEELSRSSPFSRADHHDDHDISICALLLSHRTRRARAPNDLAFPVSLHVLRQSCFKLICVVVHLRAQWKGVFFEKLSRDERSSIWNTGARGAEAQRQCRDASCLSLL